MGWAEDSTDPYKLKKAGIPTCLSNTAVFTFNLDIYIYIWIHFSKWRIAGIFKQWQNRADGKDGTPASLKESTHLYYPLAGYPQGSSIKFSKKFIFDNIFSIDVYTCKMPEYQEKLLSLLRQVCEIFGKSPDLSSMQLLGSIDGLSCVVIGNWLNEYALENIQAQDPFSYAGKVSSLLY